MLDNLPVPLPGHERKNLHWKDVLLSGGAGVGIDQWWIDFLVETTVTSHTIGEVERVGVFLHLTRSSPHFAHEPDPTFFCAYGVPVWYPWTTTQSKNEMLAHLTPLPHQLQTATTFLAKYPPSSLPEILDTQHDSENLAISEPSVTVVPSISTIKMDEFFKLRKDRNNRIEEKESAKDRQRRLDRQRNKPVKSASVILWTPNDDGEYVANPVPKREREHCFEDYNEETQMRYDAFHNEWHICDLWGSDRRDEDFEAFYAGDLREGDEIPAPPDIDRTAALDGDEWGNEDEEPRTITHADRLEGEILHVISSYFGYTPLIPVPIQPIIEDQAARMNVCRCLGIPWNLVQDHQTVFNRPSVAAAIDFFQRLQRPSCKILEDEWDLEVQNRHSIAHTSRFKCFRQVSSSDGSILFLLDLREKKKAAWYLALKHSSDIAVVCRLDQNLTEYDIVEFLLQNGIPFHTLFPSTLVLSSPVTSRPSLCPPLRKNDYVFGVNDYLAYRERCKTILRHPRGRSALMHGGVMWRLAVTVVPWEDVFRGPAGRPTSSDEMIVVFDSMTNLELLDDRLSEMEQEAICGTYHCQTG